MEPLRACLFDLDGTLIDSIELIYRSYEQALVRHGLPVPARARLLQGLGTPLAAQFGALTDDPGLVEDLIVSYREWNLAHHDALVRSYPGVRTALERLAAQGLRLGIVTSKGRETAARGLACCALADLPFEACVCLEDTARHKPHPEPLLCALQRLGLPPSAAAYVGDSPHDAASALAAGSRAVVAGWGPFGRTHFARLGDQAGPPELLWLERPALLACLAPLAAQRERA